MKVKFRNDLIISLLVFIVLIAIVFLGLYTSTPPDVVPKDAPLEVFSAERAMKHMPHIAARPHSLGSKEHIKVRNYIVDELKKLGTEPELQLTEVFFPQSFKAATVGNITVRIPGTNNSKAVLVVGHYDSVNHAFGASDDGSSIVTMLETLRLLKSIPSLKNDIIFSFSDGEEDGLLGAKAFVADHPLAKEVGLVLNFEASGTKGQSLMFETSTENSWLISEFAKAVPFPIANSLSYEIYRKMPNDTDLTPFKENGFQGLNFAFIENRFDYHTDGDNMENTSIESIQHHGSYAAALTQHFGNIDLNNAQKGNAVYFNTIGSGFIHYSYKWIIPFMVLTVLLLLFIIILGFKRKLLRAWRLVFGFLASVIHLAIAPAIITCLYFILSKYYPAGDFRLLYYNHRILLLGFVGITLAIAFTYYRLILRGVKIWQVITFLCILIIVLIWSEQMSLITAGASIVVSALIYLLFRKPTAIWELSLGALITASILMLVAGIMIPGGSYLFTWSLFCSLLPIAFYFLQKQNNYSLVQIALFVLFAVPALLWFSNMTLLLQVAMGLKMAGGAILMTVLCLNLIIPHIQIITKVKSWLIPTSALTFGIIFLLLGSTNLNYNERYKKGNSILYAMNGNTNKTAWVSFDKSADEWTSQFLTNKPDTAKILDFFPYNNNDFLIKTVELETLPVPILTVLKDSIEGGNRVLNLFLKSDREAGLMYIQMKTNSKILHAGINTFELQELKKAYGSDWYLIRYFGLPSGGIELSLKLEVDQSLEIRLNDMIIGLPDFLDKEQAERPTYMMPNGDRSMVTKSFFL